MRSAFTLIELLVVLTILTLVMGVVVPKGATMLRNYQHALDKTKGKQQLSKTRTKAFLSATDLNLTQNDTTYFITKKGVIFEKSSNDNR